ncbi:hypothetical protein L1D29_19340 [Shewanella insulae]|uniref:hypothetical protein n=1 Tax=Shewanella insulae TaxID=2681496 RepID=UPI001EFD4B46|nr:hypothetical protein [Shewanella insulae]MCG9714955.1 hypothetical protein [Shewanella insulae]
MTIATNLKTALIIDEPIPYKHPSSAVIWLDLSRVIPCKENAKKSIELIASQPIDKPTQVSPSSKNEAPIKKNTNISSRPFARDGTSFSEDLSRGGWYTVGEKVTNKNSPLLIKHLNI